MTQRKKFDWHQPGARELAESIVHGAACTEGTMVAFPTCFPAVTVPIPADESRIGTLDITDQGIVYAGTSGYAAHLLVGMFHGLTGMVFSLGRVPGADQCAAICCGTKKFAAVVNGPEGGWLVARDLERLPFDLIQEWHIARSPVTVIKPSFNKERMVHAVAARDRQRLVGVTQKRLFTFDFETQEAVSVAELPGAGRLAVGTQGGIFGRDQDQTLWRFDPAGGKLDRKAVALPAGAWDRPDLVWAKSVAGSALYTVDNQGRLFSFDETKGFAGPLAAIPLAPVGALAATLDGRVFVSAGEGIARLYCFDPRSARVSDLGVAVSVIERRRYGYAFGDAVTGRDGEIVWGEYDDLGHLWLYFPRIAART